MVVSLKISSPFTIIIPPYVKVAVAGIHPVLTITFIYLRKKTGLQLQL